MHEVLNNDVAKAEPRKQKTRYCEAAGFAARFYRVAAARRLTSSRKRNDTRSPIGEKLATEAWAGGTYSIDRQHLGGRAPGIGIAARDDVRVNMSPAFRMPPYGEQGVTIELEAPAPRARLIAHRSNLIFNCSAFGAAI